MNVTYFTSLTSTYGAGDKEHGTAMISYLTLKNKTVEEKKSIYSIKYVNILSYIFIFLCKVASSICSVTFEIYSIYIMSTVEKHKGYG